MPSRHPPTSTRQDKGFTKAETTTLLKTIEQILPIDMEAWNEVHDVFNSKHTPHGVEGLKHKFNKLANKPVPTGNPNMPEDVKLAKSIKSKLFHCSGVTNLSEEEEEDKEEEEEVDDENIMETIDDNIPSQPLITDTEIQEILNNEEEENNSTIAVEVSEEVLDTQAAVCSGVFTYHHQTTRYTFSQSTCYRSSTIITGKPMCSPNWNSPGSQPQETKNGCFTR